MRTVYRQTSTQSADNIFSQLGVSNCYCKEISQERDRNEGSRKIHSHTGYEIHMVLCGKQIYKIGTKEYEVCENELLIIPPKTSHKMECASEDLVKFAIIFDSSYEFSKGVFYSSIPCHILCAIEYVLQESKRKKHFSHTLVENRVFEILAELFRLYGYNEKGAQYEGKTADSRVELAKKFIAENIEQNLSVSDVAAYCYLSNKQLSRLFLASQGISCAKYINSEKMEKIGQYLRESHLSLKQISELFCYNNEYYFNTSFKKYFGMPPSAYRKMF